MPQWSFVDPIRPSVFTVSQDSLFPTQATGSHCARTQGSGDEGLAGWDGAVFARVAVERGVEHLDGPPGFTYLCDAQAPPVVGQRVMVPLGRGGTLAAGIVIELGGRELAEGLAIEKIKYIASLSLAVLPPDLMRLGEWISIYYLSPLGMVYSSIIPAAVKRGVGRTEMELFEPSPQAPAQEAVARLKPTARRLWSAIAALGAEEFPLPARTLAERVGMATSGAALRQLVDGGLLVSRRVSRVRAMGSAAIHPPEIAASTSAPLRLNAEQAAAVAGISQGFNSGSDGAGFCVHLLHGVTGSGKTEVYLQVLEACLRAGRNAIILVPEISLTPQTAARFTSRFGAKTVAVLHSGLTSSQRHAEWERAATGGLGGAGGEGGGEGARVVVGARSAVFAPLTNIGLMIVDEEHDGSYKQDRLPRYHGRDVAIKRAQLAGATVILGSATPSLESWAGAAGGRYKLWTLRERATGASLPRVLVVDMRNERRERDANFTATYQHLIGPTLERAIRATAAAGMQTLLLLNRRGFSSYVSCRSNACGYIVSCDQCDVNLVLHKHQGIPAGGFVCCHHCESQQLLPLRCPSCGGKLHQFAGGTQRLEDELSRKFADIGLVEGETFARIDSDSMGSMQTLHQTLARFGSGELRLLLGTQMISKGLDFPNVNLVGVIDADTALAIPDFRSTERTFSLLAQVAGRAGRRGGSGPAAGVIIQTQNPHHPAIVLAARHDYITFARDELAIRTRAGLPPMARMARIVCRDVDFEKAQNLAEKLATAMRGAAPSTVGIRGPMPCAISRIANYFRFSVDVLAPDARTLHATLDTLRRAGLLKSDAATAVDVDPVALM